MTAKSQEEAFVQQLLDMSRSRIATGDRDEALACLIKAITITRGEGAVMEVLTQAKQTATAEREAEQRLQEQRAREQEARQRRIIQEEMIAQALQASEDLVNAESILADRGDGSEEILRDAFEDGSSIVCKSCGGLVKQERWEAHTKQWCSGRETMDVEDVEDEN